MKNAFVRKASYWMLLGLLLAISVLLLFDNLGTMDIQWADESRHGVNAYEMMESGDYLVTTYLGEVDYWNLKPPLSCYAIMVGYKLFGYNAFGLRFYSAASMFGTMVLLALWMKKRYGSVASLVSQLFLMACTILYGWHFARFGDADSMYVLFYTIAMLCMLESQRDFRWMYGSAACFGLAFMTKSWHAALIPVTCFLYVCVTGQIRKLKLKHYLWLIFFGLLPIAPWAIARFRYDGLAFFKDMLGTDVITRATTVHEEHYGGWLYYVQYLFEDPATILATVFSVAALVFGVVQKKRIAAWQWGLLLWCLVPLVLYSLCVSKLAWYIFPSLLPLGMGLGIACQKLAENLRGKGFAPRAVCLAAALGLLCFWSVNNLLYVRSIKCTDEYDLMMQSFFIRERDSGMHAYIQYESENPYAPIDYRKWMQGEVLAAELAGDVLCVDGGTQAFVQDPHPSYLIAHDHGLETELLEGYEVKYRWGPLTVFRNQY